MSLGNMIGSLVCLMLWIVVLAGGSVVWLIVRGRPVTPGNVGNMIGGIVRWLVIDFMINMILSSIFDNNRRRF